ncbi:hypothetical protein G6F46_000766 [Rhizopus delemar]|nr:hypothetical protein G6F43_001488 [Rhizopus delemar]KAG1550789.1 hypothetical protein G6F51_002237 [Rhizopus arrhizus]KAG1464009.1 hypothetical protein G6F55_002047 [Rhizopus delemar]KAG1498628.1 hypothetical protein G6F54_004956 [Rhizopus delemar]KAG1516976.1 hypothetical protein G6F53_001747 [Rhizopus delemar]
MQLTLGPILLLLSLTISWVSASTTLSVCSSCTYTTITKALAAIPSGSTTYTISIAPGTYKEQVKISRSNVILKPSSSSGTVYLEYSAGHNTQSSSGSDTDSAVLTITGSNVKVYNMVVANTYKQASNIANLALNLAGTQASFYNVKFYGFQDTLLINSGGSGYFKSCYIEGSVDFIWGYGTGYFQGCTIASNQSGGFITAHNRASSSASGGFYFNSCTVKATVPSGPLSSTYSSSISFTSSSQFSSSCYLGRPWSKYARVVFMYSNLGSHIKPVGWSAWSTSDARTSNVLFGEYSNSGSGAWSSSRASFATKLSSTQAAQYSVSKVFGSTSFIDTSV